MKSVNNKQKTINKKIILFCFFLGIFSLFSLVKSAQAARIRYPIGELGNCSSPNECYLYCQIPQNTPACWSYGKFIIEPDVLGETTVNIEYPVQELANCQDAQACKEYCNNQANQSACSAFAAKYGIGNSQNEYSSSLLKAAQKDLGCNDKNSCQNVCAQEENRDKCLAFGEKWGLFKNIDKGKIKTISSTVLRQAKKDLGCSSRSECIELCQDEKNHQACFAFGNKYNLISEETQKAYNQWVVQSAKMIAESYSQLGCMNVAECKNFCELEQNKVKCQAFVKVIQNKISPSPKPTTLPSSQTGKEASKSSSLPCTTEAECRLYCQKFPEECKGYEELQNTTSQKNPTVGAYLGPGGCKTDEECLAYCKTHPSECPGYLPSKAAKIVASPTVKVSPAKSTPTSKPQTNTEELLK
jgi:hypothetical protein